MAGQDSAVLQLENQAMDCVYHPTRRLVAAALISGGVRVFDCSGAEPSSVHSWDKHKDSCRSLAFGQQGDWLCSASADRSIRGYDLLSGKAALQIKDAHDCAIERILAQSSSTLATGDEAGLVRVWDWRSKAFVREFRGHTDFISDMTYHEAENCIVAISGDGTLSINDLNSGKGTDDSRQVSFCWPKAITNGKSGPRLELCPISTSFAKVEQVRARSEETDEMTSVAVLKNGKKLVCGTQTGTLNIYSWEQIGECSDRMPGHPTCVDAVQKLDEDTLITASGDGIVRVVSIQPHALVGVLVQQDEGGCERIALSHDHRQLASTSYDALKVWDTSCLDQDDDGDDGADKNKTPVSSQEISSDEEPQLKRRKRSSKARQKSKKATAATLPAKANFFDGLL